MNGERWLQRQAQSAAWWIRLSAVAGILSGGCVIAQATAIAGIADAVIFRGAGLEAVQPWIFALAGLFPARAALAYLRERASSESALAVRRSVRETLLGHLRRLGPVGLSSAKTGEAVSAVTESVDALDPYFARYLPDRAVAAVVPLAILGVVYPLDWFSGLVLTLTAVFVPVSMILIGKGAEQLNRRQWKRLAILGGRFLDLLRGLPTVKLFGAGGREARAVVRLSEEHRAATMKVLRVAFLSAFMLELLSTISIAAVAVSIGLRLLEARMAFHGGYLILLLAPEFYRPLRNLGTQYHARMDALGAAERIAEWLKRVPPRPGTGGERRDAPELAPTLRFDGVRYTYPGSDAAALHSVSFTIRAGEHAALVGPSGAGKSTVLNLVLGFLRPETGTVRVNDIDLTELHPEQWLSNVAWIAQRPHVFSGTVRENIAMGGTTATDEEIREAARLAEADEFIARLSAGYDTPLAERGQNLSGGQIQRIAIARAFLQRAVLIVMDEPTAHLDLESERRIQRALERLTEGRTAVSIAHRLSTVERADTVIHLDGGVVRGTGTHRELLEAGNGYPELVHGAVAR